MSPNPLADILEALEVIHELGYVHRDLKPSNILLHEGRWKLSDFGFVTPPAGATHLTSTNSTWGTMAYAAPEQLTDYRDVTATADIYSFGCILHDLVDGGSRLPYDQHAVSGPLAPVVQKCTEKDPSRRFRDVGSLRSALLTILSAPVSTTSDKEANEWAAKLLTPKPWQVDELEDFCRFVKRLEPSSEELSVIFQHMTEEIWQALCALDPQLWNPLARSYCEWAHRAFEFSYCDVVVGRLVTIYGLGTLETKVDAVLAAAELGARHNRWYVMGKLVEMCSPTIDPACAQRIAIEIQIEQAQWNFRRSVSRLNLQVSAYHPMIATACAPKPS